MVNLKNRQKGIFSMNNFYWRATSALAVIFIFWRSLAYGESLDHVRAIAECCVAFNVMEAISIEEGDYS